MVDLYAVNGENMASLEARTARDDAIVAVAKVAETYSGDPSLLDWDGTSDIVEQLLNRPAWQNRAACRNVPQEVFFPTDAGGYLKAARICSSCVVRAECEEFALSRPSLKGIWAGMTERRRARVRKANITDS